MARSRVISADSHVFELPDLYVENAEAKFKDRAPHVVRLDGADWWICDGHKMLSLAGGAQVGLRFEDPEKLSFTETYEHVQAGGYDPDEHVKDMDIDGIDISILYPSVALVLYAVPDSELLTAMFRIYNDWLAEFCGAHPKQLKGIAMLNTDDVQAAVDELERCANRGFVGAMIPVSPPDEKPYDLPEYDLLWAAAQDLQMPLSLHTATNRPSPGMALSDIDDVSPDFVCNMDHWVRNSLAQIIYSGAFQRFPKLSVGSAEHELSWAPHFLDRLDYTYTQRAHDVFQSGYWDRYTGEMLPSDYFHSNVFVGFQEDGVGIRLRDSIGVDSLQWGNDYPHQESTFPKSQEFLQELLADCTEEQKTKITGGNAARVYHLD